ncbi:Protein RUFY3 [Lamellibrachia satsuma]|nr:Protein RUFY3 [Lamellibrachia satsuma]
MAEETIYLCNFRVSVDGDWLCLKELTDVNLDLRLTQIEDEPNPASIERANLLIVCKLVVKEVISSSLKHGRMLDDEHAPLQQFFVVLEHVLRHRIKPKKGILRDRREVWSLLEQVERYVPDAVDITTSVKEMPHIKSAVGRGRAWLRLALMQKRLADYFRVLIDKKEDILGEYYEDGSIMLEDEGEEIAGLMVGLNVIDFNMAIKDKDLDQPLGVIDFSLYLQDRVKIQSPEDESQGQAKMAAILDQKNYLEELNRHLNATVTNLQQKLETVQTANTLMKEDLAIAKNTILELQQQNTQLCAEKDKIMSDFQKQIETAKVDLDTERETYETSRTGLDSMYQDMQKKLQEETRLRLDVEKEMELQIGMKQEVELAMRLLEKDIHEKTGLDRHPTQTAR